MIAILTIATGAIAQSVSFAPSAPIVTGKLLLSVDKLRAGDSFDAAVSATVSKGYHIGAHEKDALYPAKLTLEAPKGVTFDEPVFPEATILPSGKVPVYEGTFIVKVTGHVAGDAKLGAVTITAKLDTQGCKDEQCFPPSITESSVKTDVVAPGAQVKKINVDVFGTTAAGSSDAAGQMAGKLEKMNPITRLLALYLGGLLLAFTPCVYPMIPVTIGYFGNQSGKKRKIMLLAGVYVLGLALTYSILGAIAATTGGMFGAAMQSPAVLIGIAVVLVGLALSMFGLYELQAPTFIQSKASGRSGVLGALIMGLIFGVVAAPCVGPMVLGLLLFAAKLGSPLMGFLLFFPLSLGIGTPLFILATTSAKMPLPGMWMVAVKRVAGFLLIGAAAYFMLPIIPQPIGRFLIPAVILAAAIYLGWFEESVRSHKLGSSCSRVFCSVAAVVAIAMIWPHAPSTSLKWDPYTAQAVTQAAGEHRPVMIDFTAKWCQVCQELEHGPFSDPKVIKAASALRRFRVDATNSTKLVQDATKKYGIHGFPAVIFIDRSGKEVSRVTSLATSGEMIKRIGSVK